MSTRLLLNAALGTVAILLVASVGVVLTSSGDTNNMQAHAELAAQQEILIETLSTEVAKLSDAGNLIEVTKARKELGQTVVQFDQNLKTLLHGGNVSRPDNSVYSVEKISNENAKEALDQCVSLWQATGLPLADLAAGDFSIFSAAGQQAITALKDNSADIIGFTNFAVDGSNQGSSQPSALASMASYAAMGFGALLVGLSALWFVKRSPKIEKANEQKPNIAQQPDPGPLPNKAASAQPKAEPIHQQEPNMNQTPPMPSWPGQDNTSPFKSPVDFDNVNASVDQMSLDMNTIANSTDKMRLAIDSVGHALQGMLYSLNEMAQDTAEGHNIVRNANNAASYTATTAGELALSSQEMSRVVGRVTQLALHTKQIAAQIEADAVHTGKTGEAFTSVVASEVQGLAGKTNNATAEIEQTVAEILGTARQYEDAIGQIIKNISGINKVSKNLGELMLHPPQTVVPGIAVPAAQAAPPLASPVAQVVPAAAPAPVAHAAPAAPAAPQPPQAAAPVAETPAPPAAAEPTPAAKDDSWGAVADDPVVKEPTPEAVAESTTEVIEEVAEESAEEPSGSAGNVFMLGGGPKKKKAPAKKEPKAEEPAPEPEAKAEEPAAAEDDGNIFMLNKPAKKAEPKAEAAKEEPKAEEPAPEPAAEEEDTNIFMLNKPAKKAEPKAEAAKEEPKAEEPAPEPEPEVEEESGPNIYNLDKPVKKAAPKAKEPKAEEPVTVPAAEEEEEKKDDGGNNVFMLNKPK